MSAQHDVSWFTEPGQRFELQDRNAKSQTTCIPGGSLVRHDLSGCGAAGQFQVSRTLQVRVGPDTPGIPLDFGEGLHESAHGVLPGRADQLKRKFVDWGEADLM